MKKRQLGQAIIELAVFGAIIIFVIGAIVRQGMSSTQNENMTMKSMRQAMKMSYLESVLGEGDGNSSRNNASFLLVEDRLSAEFSRYGSISRTPYFSQGSGTFSNNLLMPLDWGEPVPIFDVMINGQHFDFTTARFVTKPFGKDDIFYEVVASGTQSGFCVTNCTPKSLPGGVNFDADHRFDLNRNGDFSDDPRSTDQRALISWQWDAEDPRVVREEINVDDAVFPVYDVDGDKQSETIFSMTLPTTGHDSVTNTVRDLDGLVGVLDFQDGDVDFSRSVDEYPDPRLAPGLKQEADIYTQTNDGTYLLIQEGAQFDNTRPGYDLVSSTTSKGQIDVVSRMFRLSNDTGRWCRAVPITETLLNEDGTVNPMDNCPANRPDPTGNNEGRFKVVTDSNCVVQQRTVLDDNYNPVLNDPRPILDSDGDPVLDSEGNPTFHPPTERVEDVYVRTPNYPVEACYNCFAQQNISKTCFTNITDVIEDENGTPIQHRGFAIFIRSRIGDERTRQWITDFTEDVDGFQEF